MTLHQNRRQLLKAACALVGVSLTPSLLAKVSDDSILYGTPELRHQLGELVDLILPKTDTPSASEVKAHHFVLNMIQHSLTPKEIEHVYQQISQHHQRWQASEDLDAFMARWIEGHWGKASRDFFALLKQQTLVGYYSSETIATQVLAYLPMPGTYKGDIEFTQGWAQ